MTYAIEKAFLGKIDRMDTVYRRGIWTRVQTALVIIATIVLRRPDMTL